MVNYCEKALWLRLLDVTCCAGSIPSELGKLSALQLLDLSFSNLSGEPKMCLGVSGTFVVSHGGDVSKDEIHDVEEENCICLKLLLGLFFLRTGLVLYSEKDGKL